MGVRSFIGGFAAAALLAVAGGIWLLREIDMVPVRYPPPEFYDDGDLRPDSGYVVASGVLLGEDMDGRTYLKVTCDRSIGVCRTLELTQVNNLKMVNTDQDEWKITAWTPESIKAASEPMPSACNRVEFTIYRTNKEAVYTRIPNPNAKGEICKDLSNSTFNWKLGPQPVPGQKDN